MYAYKHDFSVQFASEIVTGVKETEKDIKVDSDYSYKTEKEAIEAGWNMLNERSNYKELIEEQERKKETSLVINAVRNIDSLANKAEHLPKLGLKEFVKQLSKSERSELKKAYEEEIQNDFGPFRNKEDYTELKEKTYKILIELKNEKTAGIDNIDEKEMARLSVMAYDDKMNHPDIKFETKHSNGR